MERAPWAYRLEGRGKWVVVRACGEGLDCRPVARVRESTLRFFIDKLVEDGHRKESRLFMVATLYPATAVLLAAIYLVRGRDFVFDRGFSGTVKLVLVGIPLMSVYMAFWGLPLYGAVVAIIHSDSFHMGGGESLRRQLEIGVVGVGGTEKTRRDSVRVFTDFVNRHGEELPEGPPPPGSRRFAF